MLSFDLVSLYKSQIPLSFKCMMSPLSKPSANLFCIDMMNFAKVSSYADGTPSVLPTFIYWLASKILESGMFKALYTFFKKYYRSSRFPKLCEDVRVLTEIP